MIVKKTYTKYDRFNRKSEREGWFLFGVIPLYIRVNKFHY